jgi:hypothetical protein
MSTETCEDQRERDNCHEHEQESQSAAEHPALSGQTRSAVTSLWEFYARAVLFAFFLS